MREPDDTTPAARREKERAYRDYVDNLTTAWQRGRTDRARACPQRAPRVAALERELDELHRVEEVLVATAIAAGSSVHRSPSAPPAAVLGVRVAERASRAA